MSSRCVAGVDLMGRRGTNSTCTADGIDPACDLDHTEYVVQVPHEVSKAAAWVATRRGGGSR